MEAELVEAFKEGDAENARALLKKGADPNFLDPETQGTLLQVAALNGHSDCVEAALEAGADTEIAHPVFGMTPFLWACHNAHLACVEQLVRAGCEIEAVDSSGLNGQELAKDNLKPGWENIVKFLTEHGAEAIDVSKELAFSNEQKKRMRKTLGASAGDDDALNLLFTTEQTKQGGKKKNAGSRGAAVDEKAQAEAAKTAAKEAELRSAFTAERIEELFGFVDARLAEAASNETLVTKMLHEICKQCKGRMYGLEFNIKERESTFSKVLRKMGPVKGLSDEEQNEAFTKAINSLRDLLRYTMVLKTKTYVKGVNETIQLFHQNGVEPVPNTIKNFWRRKGQDTDYLGINGSFQMEDGFPFELQFHTDESIETKQERAHHSFEQFRLTTGLEKLQYWEDMVRMWAMVPIPDGDLFSIGTKAYHGVDRKSLEATLSQEEREELKHKRSLEAEVRPACDRVYATNLKLAAKLTVGIKSGAKKDGGSLRGEEHICKNAMSMTRKVVSDLLAEGWTGGDMGLDRALMAAVDTEKRNSLRYTIVFSEKNYVRGVKRVFEYLKKQGFEQTLMNNYWMGDEPYNAVRGRLHCEVKDDTHDVAVVFHTGVSLKMSEERMVRFQEAMGIVFHTATLVSSEEGSEDRRQQAEDLLRQDQAWVARCANLAANKPTGVETIGKVIATKTREQRMQEKEESKRDSMRRGSMSLSSSTKKDRTSAAGSLMRDKQQAKIKADLKAAQAAQPDTSSATAEPGGRRGSVIAEGSSRRRGSMVVQETSHGSSGNAADAMFLPGEAAGLFHSGAGKDRAGDREGAKADYEKAIGICNAEIEMLDGLAEADVEGAAAKADAIKNVMVPWQRKFTELKERPAGAPHPDDIPEAVPPEPEPEPEPRPEQVIRPAAIKESDEEDEDGESSSGEYESGSGSEYETDESGSEYETDSDDEDEEEVILESNQSVVQLLMVEKMQSYFKLLQDAGLDKPSALVDATAADLKAIGIKGGHAKRFLKLVAASAEIQAAAKEYKKQAAAKGVVIAPKPKPAAKQQPAPKPEAAKPKAREGVHVASENMHEALRSGLAGAGKSELLQRVWAKVDTDGNGTLDHDEVRMVLVQMGWENISSAKLENVMMQIDTDRSGDVDFDEFSEWFMLQDTSKQEAMITVYYQDASGAKAQTTMAGIPQLLESGAIRADTLVWIEGMDDWTALNEAHGTVEAVSEDVSATLKGVLQSGLANVERKSMLLQKVWDHVDADGNGTLDREEVHLVLVQMGWEQISKRLLDKVMAEIDTDNSGDVDFEEFSAWFMKQDSSKQEAMVKLYYQDKDGERAETTMAELGGLVKSGEIGSATLVWIEGMGDWTALGETQEHGITDALHSAVDSASQETQKKLLQAVWKKADADGSGALDRDEMAIVL